MERSNQIQDWLSLATTIQVQFGPSQFDNPRAELLKIIDDTLLMEYFVGDLIPQLRKEVIAQVERHIGQRYN